MFAIRRFVRGSLTLADTGEQLFPLLCAINVPLTSSLPVLLTIEISHPQFDLGPADDSVGNRSTDPARWRKRVRGRFAAYFFVTCRGVDATLILFPRWVSGMGRQA
ncbi:MAG: hypothetical protein H7270_16240 [Dermatophilaceae bacterium]|nr:hypothetical protein [Dermatophilaceae bacterium]